MDFTTIILENKRSSVIIKANIKYDMFKIFPDLLFIKENNVFKVDEGKIFFDFIGDQGPLKFMSEQFKNLLEDNGIKGLEFFPIIMEGIDLKYYGYTKKTFNSYCKYDEDGDSVYGTFEVDMTLWDGSDIFFLKDSGATVCTPRVREIIEKAKITNVEFKDLSKY
ncbi:hypothetical protein GKZ90_0022280 [Flavobacterium sp. MC2016-06]|uniref:hypothetical protein n=1 Tax=Flavobacterium sp. MC2016-06 TaxID=2676308 RepID=UPI0012BA9801|nr:hypothetical protein [Flavobacterium sp. MC2016-06]MBU3861270.1 hypothetical protein [Flavobacterium sp. MC2016-06]